MLEREEFILCQCFWQSVDSSTRQETSSFAVHKRRPHCKRPAFTSDVTARQASCRRWPGIALKASFRGSEDREIGDILALCLHDTVARRVVTVSSRRCTLFFLSVFSSTSPQPSFLSKLTAAALEDLHYVVDSSKVIPTVQYLVRTEYQLGQPSERVGQPRLESSKELERAKTHLFLSSLSS